jgi:hypothetical protein
VLQFFLLSKTFPNHILFKIMSFSSLVTFSVPSMFFL